MNQKQITVNIEKVVDEILSDYKRGPVDLLSIGDADGEYRYLSTHRYSYIRTISDLVTYFTETNINSIKVLEIGCFLGLVSMALSKLGFIVTVGDIKEFISCKNLQYKFNKYNITYAELNLSDYKLPFNDEEYDAVIMCEVLEHLNFNPLPVIKEINRIIKPNGLFYLALPNIARLDNRLKMLQGKSIHNPIKGFFDQLGRNNNMIVGLHWREYATDEIKEMLEQMDFEVIKQKYDLEPGLTKIGLEKIIRKLIGRIINFGPIKKVIYRCIFDDPDSDPTLRNTQVNFALKKKECLKEFNFTDATLPK